MRDVPLMPRRTRQPAAPPGGHRARKSVALGLSVFFFGLAIFATPASVRHSLIHSRHTAVQHTTFVCTWMCAATAFAQVSSVVPAVTPAPRLAGLPSPLAVLVQAAPATLHARAPPA